MTKLHIVNRFRDNAELYGSNVAAKSREDGEWVSYSWTDLEKLVEKTSLALINEGLVTHGRVGIYSNNSVMWSIADMATLYCRAITVPLYSTNTVEQSAYVVNDAGVSVLFVGNKCQLNNALAMAESCSSLKRIVVLESGVEIPSDTIAVSFKEFVDAEVSSDVKSNLTYRLNDLSMDDLFTLIYTSGTTGTPKGVMLDFNNLASQVSAHEDLFDLKAGEQSLCFLPLSHVFERAWSYFVMHSGVVNCYLGDTNLLREAFREIKPNYMSAVPRVYEKLYSAIQDKVSKASLLKKLLFTWSIDTGYRVALKKQNGEQAGWYLSKKMMVAEKLVLKNLRGLLGGKIRVAPAGGAKLDPGVGRFFHALGLDLKLGYGMTETTATVSIWRDGLFDPDSVGVPVDGAEVKIGDNDEILVRGPMVMRGYYNMPKETAEVFTEDGFLKTGDAGYIDEKGNLFITDRIKDLMKTSCGKYVAPQVVEGVIGKDRFIEQVAVIADAKKYVSALVVPCYEAIEDLAKELNIKYQDRIELIKNAEVRSVIEKRIAEIQKDLAKFEQVKKFTLLPKEFTMKSGELTPTQKLKRKVIQENYREEIDNMYDDKKDHQN